MAYRSTELRRSIESSSPRNTSFREKSATIEQMRLRGSRSDGDRLRHAVLDRREDTPPLGGDAAASPPRRTRRNLRTFRSREDFRGRSRQADDERPSRLPLADLHGQPNRPRSQERPPRHRVGDGAGATPIASRCGNSPSAQMDHHPLRSTRIDSFRPTFASICALVRRISGVRLSI